ncbi:hypothetical protein A9Q74_05160 [Colwellia sp. 39_35_sub15_T18]|nr:hypothetical protein A9Q74_05160 [Colwellia sp. 39_35_sub15_T18]
MSSGGFSAPPRGANGIADDSVCSRLVFETKVANADEDLIEKLKEGMLLDVSLVIENGVESVAILFQGQILGGIMSHGAQLKSCLEHGFEFIAVVLSVSMGIIVIKVQPRN